MLPRESRALSLPTIASLATGISSALCEGGERRKVVKILGRTANPYASSLPSEIVNCLLIDGTSVRVLCKYGVVFEQSSESHRGGVEYEAMVYRDVLSPARATAPRFYGTFAHPVEGSPCLVMEYVESALRFNETPASDAVARVASWLGGFHKECEAVLSMLSRRGLLHRYGSDYFIGWADRTVKIARALGRKYSWLPPLRDGFGELIPLLLTSGVTVAHGELYPHNILLNRRGVFPIDWETAAIAAGAIDVAAAVEGWRDEAVTEFELVYRRTRWTDPSSAPEEETLVAARLYWLFRWLGDRSEWTRSRQSTERFESLLRLGCRNGII
jgi:hypothetical protein